MELDEIGKRVETPQIESLTFFAVMNEDSRPVVQRVLCAGSDPNCGNSSSGSGSSSNEGSRLRAGTDPNGYFSGPEKPRETGPTFGPDMEYRYGCGTSFGKFNCGFGWKDR